MNFAIIRTQKLKSISAVVGSARHTFREIPTPNADKERTHFNKTEGAQSSLALARSVNARLPAKRRRDAVICIEYLITASPEWWKSTPVRQQNEYLKASIDWLKGRHGEENVVCLNVQLDETSPHLVAYVVPLTKDGRLSARDFLGGPAKMIAMQTEFAKVVGAPFGLQRGLQGSKAIHTTAAQYNAVLQKNSALIAPKLPAPTIGDRITGKAGEQRKKYEEEQLKYVALIEQSRNVVLMGQRARVQQAKAITRLRQEVEEARQFELEAIKLRVENMQLQRTIQEERSYFQRQIDGLQAQLTRMVEQAKSFLKRIGLLTREKDAAETKSEELERLLHSDETYSRARPKSQ
jgi:hypothetical protein